MNDLIATFHIDWKLMLAQIFNFALVFVILYFIAIKPLRKVIRDRHTDITTGLENAEKSKVALSEAEETKKEIEKEARMKAVDTLTKAEEDGKGIVAQAQVDAEKEKQGILENGRAMVDKERESMIKELNTETAKAVVMSVEKILKNTMTGEKSEKIIKEILAK
jgi:ATP synthase F0 subunit b